MEEGAISQLISGAINDAIEVRDNRRRGRGIEGGLDGTWMGWKERRANNYILISLTASLSAAVIPLIVSRGFVAAAVSAAAATRKFGFTDSDSFSERVIQRASRAEPSRRRPLRFRNISLLIKSGNKSTFAQTDCGRERDEGKGQKGSASLRESESLANALTLGYEGILSDVRLKLSNSSIFYT